MRNLPARLMTGYKRNGRHRRSRALYGRKVSNKLRGDSGRSRREVIGRLAGLKASKECGVFRRTPSQEESLKMPLHLLMLGRCDIIRAKGKPVPVVHRSFLCNTCRMTAELLGGPPPRIPLIEPAKGTRRYRRRTAGGLRVRGRNTDLRSYSEPAALSWH